MSEFDLTHLAVGDTVTVVTPLYSRHVERKVEERKVEEHKVVKVGRTLFYVQERDYGDPTAFYRNDGRERMGPNDNSTYKSHAYTPETWVTKQRRDAVESELYERIDKGYSQWKRAMTTDQLERVLAILNESASVPPQRSTQ